MWPSMKELSNNPEAIRAREYRRKNHAKRLEVERRYESKRLGTRGAYMKQYAQNNKDIRKANALLHNDEIRARAALRHQVRIGKIKRGVCEVCGSINTNAHHDDYSKPLKIRWFCHKHHMEHHKLRSDSDEAMAT